MSPHVIRLTGDKGEERGWGVRGVRGRGGKGGRGVPVVSDQTQVGHPRANHCSLMV